MKSVVHTQVQFWREFSGRNAPTSLTIKCLLDKSRDTENVQDNVKGHTGWSQSFRTENHIWLWDDVRSSLQGNLWDVWDRSFKVFKYANNAPESSPVSVQDTNFTTSDWCKLRDVRLGKPSVSNAKKLFSMTMQISTLMVIWTNRICTFVFRLSFTSISITHT